MAARKASCSSESLACRLSEASLVSAHASNADVFGVPDTSLPLGCKTNSIILDHSHARKENPVMDSCWIRRLNPACQTKKFEEKESQEHTHVRTHFTKHFCSSSTRLGKELHHSRSLSWPPNERTTNFSALVSNTQEPVDIREQHCLLSRATLPTFREESSRVPYQDAIESDGFFSKAKSSSQKSLFSPEAVVPCSRAARAWDDGEGRNLTIADNRHLRRWLAKDDGFVAGDFNSNLRRDGGSYPDIGFGRVSGKDFDEGKSAPSNLAQRMVHTRGFRLDAASQPSFLSYCHGASADADDSLTKFVFPSTPFNLSNNSEAEVFADVVKEINEKQIYKKNIGKGCSKDRKSGQNFGFLRLVGRSKTSDKSTSPCKYHGICNCECSAKRVICNRDFTMPTSHKSNQIKQSIGFDTVAANGGSSQPLWSSNKDFKREIFNVTREEDHWINLLQDPASGDLADSSYLKVIPPREHIMDGYHMCRLDQATNLWKPDERNKSHSFTHPCHQIPVNHPSVKLNQSWNVKEKAYFPANDTFIATMHTDLVHKHVSPDRSPSEESFMHGTLQEECVQGEMRRLVSQTNQIEQLHKFSDNEGRTADGPSRQSNQAWIQRWCSSFNSATPGGTLLLPSARQNKDFEIGFLKETPLMASKIHTESPMARKRYHDGGLGADTPGNTFPVDGRYTSVRGKYMPPSREAMAIVGSTASKPHRTSMKRSDSFLVWPSPSKENCQERELSKHSKGIREGTLQGEDTDNVEFFERSIW